MEREQSIAFVLRTIHNRTRAVIDKSFPRCDNAAPHSQLQGGIMGYLYHHRQEAVYQKDLEKAFQISRATASNALQVMEKNGLIVRKSQDKDARLKRILITEPALKRHEKVEKHMEMLDSRMIQGMTCEEVAELRRLLNLLLQNLTAMEAEENKLEEADAVNTSFPQEEQKQ